MTLTIGSTTNCLTRTNVPTSTVFTVAASTVPIIAPFGTSMTITTDINRRRNTTTIRGLVITVMATEVIDPVSDWGRSKEPLQSHAAV